MKFKLITIIFLKLKCDEIQINYNYLF